MTYDETLHFLYSRLPMFTRIGASAIKKDLTNTLALCKNSGNPHHKFKTIHIGGTNGKGSTSHMLAAILQTAGYKTGLYTSPHLKDFRERIRINGEMISEKEIVDFVNRNYVAIEEIEPSFFEVTVAMAFDHFARHNVEIAIIEVGLGGRLDSTNVITPMLSIITNIGYDHMNLLGDSLKEIAVEKAGIIKPGIPVVIGERQPEVSDIFIQKAKETNSNIVFASDEWNIETQDTRHKTQEGEEFLEIKVKRNFHPSNLSSVSLDLTGSYQLKNLATVLSSVEQLQKQGFIITDGHITTALKQVKKLTGLMGRWQILSQHPLIICDTGHNEDGIREVIKNIRATPHQNLHMVIGMVKDKAIEKVLELLPKNAMYYFCKPNIERGKEAHELATEAGKFGLHGDVHPSVKAALEKAKICAKKEDLIFVGGSTFVVAEVI